MIFNCLQCCKAISSMHKSCPYCMIEISSALEKVGIENKPMTLEKPAIAKLPSARPVAKTVMTIAQLLHLKRAAKV